MRVRHAYAAASGDTPLPPPRSRSIRYRRALLVYCSGVGTPNTSPARRGSSSSASPSAIRRTAGSRYGAFSRTAAQAANSAGPGANSGSHARRSSVADPCAGGPFRFPDGPPRSPPCDPVPPVSAITSRRRSGSCRRAWSHTCPPCSDRPAQYRAPVASATFAPPLSDSACSAAAPRQCLPERCPRLSRWATMNNRSR